MKKKDWKKLDFLNYDDFRRLAKNSNISKYQKIGFPDEYRKNYEKKIVNDIFKKLPALSKRKKIIADIGCGCSDQVALIAKKCKLNSNKLYLVDSAEMLSLIPKQSFIVKIEGEFPKNASKMAKLRGKIDGVIIYSVLHNAMLGANLFSFIDEAVALLAPGGACLIGDIPNISKRNRFFQSERGRQHHKMFMKSSKSPRIRPFHIHLDRIDDGIVFGIMQRYRNFGFETYLMPEADDIHFSTRREDILIVKN